MSSWLYPPDPSTATPSCSKRRSFPKAVSAWARPRFYSTIQRLVSLHLIDETPGLSEEDSRRRYYELTGAGHQLLEAEVQRMNAAVRMANARLTRHPSQS